MARIGTVDILGGGPAGLYAAILARRMLPGAAVRVTERNPVGATFGFGVVFSDRALDFLAADDPETHDLIAPRMERWRDMVLNHPDGREVLDGVGFSAIGRLELIEILRARAEALGAELRFGRALTAPPEGADLVIGADGLNSLVRDADPAFAPQIDHFENRFAWYGASRPFDTLTQTFIKTDKGALNAHHYRYAPARSTFIVEAGPEAFAAHGFAEMSEEEGAAHCAALFADVLEGAELICNRSVWRRFPRLWCQRWTSGRAALIGDAAHTAHFSIGSGTRLAMEDALSLIRHVAAAEDVEQGLTAYDAARRPVAAKIVAGANSSASWYDRFEEKMALPPLDFAFDYLTRSGRMDRARLRAAAPAFMARYEAAETIADPAPADAPGALAIGFRRADHPNCSSILWDNLERGADEPALLGPAGAVTYAELIAEASRWGAAFRDFGLKRGERIPFLLDDTPALPAAFFGAVRAGFIPVLLNIQTRPDLLSFYLADTEARLAVTEAAFAPLFTTETLAGTAVATVVAVNGEAEGTVAASSFLPAPADLSPADTAPEDMAFWMYSSGSTGQPKGIVHLHHDMAFTQASYGALVLGLRPDDIVYSVPKMYFAYGFGNSVTFPFSVGAASVLTPGAPNPQAVFGAIETWRPSVFFGLPTLYTALARAEGAAARDLSSIRLSLSAAEILSEEIYRAWEGLTGAGPMEGLGSTEMLHIYLSNRPGDHRPGAAGAPVPGYEIRLETPEGARAAPGEEGVMLVRGDSAAPCYWRRPDKTRETMRGGWIHTGDRFVERDGYYYFQGRADDLVKVSGQWVWPLEVERCLAEHPHVHECCVLAESQADRRMALRAVVRLAEGAAADEAGLRDFVKARLTPYKAPRLFDFVAEIPKTGTGKIDRQALAR